MGGLKWLAGLSARPDVDPEFQSIDGLAQEWLA